MRYTPENITHLEPNEIFCFGSNRDGRHGKGAAKTAMKWGAKYGEGEGLYGKTYALPTLDARFRKLPIANISIHISRFFKQAERRPSLTFLVTKVGCGLAHFKVKEIAPLFFQWGPIPENVILPEEFWKHQPTEL